jgi:hypothetical protein
MARTCFWTLVAGMFLGSACLAFLSWLDWEPQDRPPRPEWYYQVDRDRERDREEQLENLRKDLLGREEKKKRLAQDVIDRRVTLWQAAASLRDMESGGVSAVHYANLIRILYPGKTVEESSCRKVISLVKEALEQEPDRCVRVLASLEAELEDETVSSPSPPTLTIQTPAWAHE